MFNNVALDVVIGLVFIFLLYSLLVTIIQEIIANKFSYRAKFLEKAIARMLEDDDNKKSPILVRLGFQLSLSKAQQANSLFTSTFYKHPLIKYLGERPGKSKPSYLVSETFSKVIVDILRGDNISPGQEIRSAIQNTLDKATITWGNWGNSMNISHPIKPQTLLYLKSIWADSQGDVERFKEILENWFNETMDRTTGWYKKYAQFISLVIGFFIAVGFNVNTIEIAHKLEKDPKLREQIVQQADAFLKEHPNLGDELQKAKDKLKGDSNKSDSIAAIKDSLVKASQKEVDRYEKLKETGDSLIKSASDLVQGDLQKTNEILGIGISSYKKAPCDDCGCWKNFWVQVGHFFKSLFGWLITALALSLGAPFWFDLLNKLMKLRSSVAPAPAVDEDKKGKASVAKVKRVG
jgi:hypothetical protein